ncbi:hypothetical protein Q3C01_08660 [Bradyrhizobium sp. UFLA05-109]
MLSIYYEDRRETQANKAKFDERIARLNKWWGGKVLSDVNGANCRAYTKWRGNNGGSRRDLEDLRAAINQRGFSRFAFWSTNESELVGNPFAGAASAGEVGAESSGCACAGCGGCPSGFTTSSSLRPSHTLAGMKESFKNAVQMRVSHAPRQAIAVIDSRHRLCRASCERDQASRFLSEKRLRERESFQKLGDFIPLSANSPQSAIS